MSEVLSVAIRPETGKLRMRRLRAAGQIPAVLYGHGEANVNLAVPTRDVDTLIRHGSHFVELQGAVNEHAMVAEVRWDGLGKEVLHLDFLRINVNESVEIDLPLELKGEAPGTKAGGVLNFVLHEITVRGPANKLPDKVEVRIGELELGKEILAGQIRLPDGVELVSSPSELVVDCQLPRTDEEAKPADFASEPEVIGRKAEEEEGEASEA